MAPGEGGVLHLAGGTDAGDTAPGEFGGEDAELIATGGEGHG